MLSAQLLVARYEGRVLLAQLGVFAIGLRDRGEAGFELFDFAAALAELLIEQVAQLVEISDARGKLGDTFFELGVFFFNTAAVAVATSRQFGGSLAVTLLQLFEHRRVIAQVLIQIFDLGLPARRLFVVARQGFAFDLKLRHQMRELRDRVFKLGSALLGGFLQAADVGGFAVEAGAQ